MAKCFVIQPFDNGGPYDKRYADILKPAIEEADLEPYRVDEDPSVEIPIEDIEKGIRDSEVCLADITTNNPNVWYEVGFAFANGKRVVLICARPRPEKFPFDVHHRHVTEYTLDSSSDFEKLKKAITVRLRAQAKKAEAIQTVAALSQVTNTEGLAPQEIAALVTMMSILSSPDGGVTPNAIKDSMGRSGYTPVASTIALAGLARKEMIDYYQAEDRNNVLRSYCRITEKGYDWILENQNLFSMRETPAPGSDEEIPF